MRTRLFQKPKPSGAMPVLPEEVFKDPRKLKVLKIEVKPEEYLKSIYNKISEKELELASFERRASERKDKEEQSLAADKLKRENEINTLEAVLVEKRAERANLEKPLTERIAALDNRENVLNDLEKTLKDNEQSVFEREKACDVQLDGIKDMADELGETRLRLSVKEKQLKGREDRIKEGETAHMLKVDKFSQEVNKAAAIVQERENAVLLKEQQVDAKEENLVKREKELLNGHILLNDRRGVLARAWKELGEKQHGKSNRPSRCPA